MKENISVLEKDLNEIKDKNEDSCNIINHTKNMNNWTHWFLKNAKDNVSHPKLEKDDILIFTYETYIGGPANGPDTKTEYRTYISNNKTIKYMENQNISVCTTCQFNDSSREYKALRAYNTNNIKSALCN